jgi:hypothetical protein
LHVVEDQPGSIAGTQGRAAQKASQGEKKTQKRWMRVLDAGEVEEGVKPSQDAGYEANASRRELAFV